VLYAVLPARNEAARIEQAIRTVRAIGCEKLVVVANGCVDDTLAVVRRLQGADLTLLAFRAPLGVDVPRAVGAAYAYAQGASHVLFYDGDLVGAHADALRQLVTSAQRFAVDLALTDPYGTTHAFDPGRDLMLKLRAELNRRLGLEPRLGLSNPAHGPHVLSRRLLAQLDVQALAQPPLVLLHAAQLGFHIDALAHIPHPRLGSAHKGPAHSLRIRDTIIGDLLEALAHCEKRPVHRTHRGEFFDGYHSERRFDLLERFVQSLRKKTFC